MDLVIRGGQIYDGTGAEPYQADVGVTDGIIVAVGEVADTGVEEIDATGCLVTPGFVDIHAHYDGQIIWGERLTPSSEHGVTTVLTGNCGVGFAPCRAEDRSSLIELMEGVEDIPEVVMTAGLPWSWTTFPEYLDVVGANKFDVDVATQLPHSALRVFVMGERGLNREDATEADLDNIRTLTQEAMEAGALGVGTSDTMFHRTSSGDYTPTWGVAKDEMMAIAEGMKSAGHGVLETLLDLGAVDEENALAHIESLADIERVGGQGLSFTLLQVSHRPTLWAKMLDHVAEVNAKGAKLKAQVIGRPVGILLGHSFSYNPFQSCPSYAPLIGLDLDAKVERLRDPELRERLLSERPVRSTQPIHAFARQFERMYPIDKQIDYEPAPGSSMAAQADELGITPLELAYDHMLSDDGRAGLYVAVGNYADGNLDHTLDMMNNEHTLLGLGDGGAHLGIICDASYPTHMLAYWGRDREVGMSLPTIIHKLTQDTAQAIGLHDRGVLAPGYRADVNVIDHEALTLFAPESVRDLPADGLRLVQHAEGYRATVVAGTVTYRNGQPTGELPGRLIRGPQPSPVSA